MVNMLIDEVNHTIKSKIVYYGPAMSGKTTSVRALFQACNRLQDLRSIETTTGRTLYWDFGTLNVNLKEWNIQLLVFSATGQDYYALTRSPTLAGADAVVFVADSDPDLLQDNVRSWRELLNFLGVSFKEEIDQRHLDQKLPIIFCINKWDQNHVDETLFRTTFRLHENIVLFPTIATEGLNITRVFGEILKKIFEQGKIL